jgi:hypothetical protein
VGFARSGSLLGNNQKATRLHLPAASSYYLPTFFGDFLKDFFGSGFGKYFYGVFELVMQRNGQKRDEKIEGNK